MTENHVRCFPSDAGKPGQLFHRCWDLAAKFFNQLLRATLERFGLGAKKSQGPDELLDLGCRGLGEFFRTVIATKKLRGNFIYRLVGALGRQNDGDEQLKSVVVSQWNFEFGISLG